jgi:hypothetical protein
MNSTLIIEIQIGELQAKDKLKEKEERQEYKNLFQKEKEKTEKLEKDLVTQRGKLRENIDRGRILLPLFSSSFFLQN